MLVERCELTDLPTESCDHCRTLESANRKVPDQLLLVSPRGLAHFSGCMHKGDDPDFSDWSTLEVPNAWERLGNRETLVSDGGARAGREVVGRCFTCVETGP